MSYPDIALLRLRRKVVIENEQVAYNKLIKLSPSETSLILKGEVKTDFPAAYGLVLHSVAAGRNSFSDALAYGSIRHVGNIQDGKRAYELKLEHLPSGDYIIVTYLKYTRKRGDENLLLSMEDGILGNYCIFEKLNYTYTGFEQETTSLIVEGYCKTFPIVLPSTMLIDSFYAQGFSTTHENTEIPPHQYFPINLVSLFVEGSISEIRIPGTPESMHDGLFFVEGYYEVFPIPNPIVPILHTFFSEGFSTTHENTEIPPHQYKEIKLIEMYTEGYARAFPIVNPIVPIRDSMFVEGYSGTHESIDLSNIIVLGLEFVSFNSADRELQIKFTKGGWTPPEIYYEGFGNEYHYDSTGEWKLSAFVVEGDMQGENLYEYSSVSNGTSIMRVIDIAYGSGGQDYVIEINLSIDVTYRDALNNIGRSVNFEDDNPVKLRITIPGQ